MREIQQRHWILVVLVLAALAFPNSANSGESRFLADLNAYNPIPSPDGCKIAFVVWGRRDGVGGLGRSSFRSDVRVADKDGKLLSEKPLADAFLAEWTPDSERLVCYRDWRFFLVGLDGSKFQAGYIREQESRPERVQYHLPTRRFLWIERDFSYGVVRTDAGTELARHENTLSYFALSSDGEWLAAISEGQLVVLNIASKKWTKLGRITVHPDPEWDYKNPSCNPWFKHAAQLAFVSEQKVIIATPDGKQKETLCELSTPGGLATASPDGSRVAFVTFVERPKKTRADLKFWGNARVWVVSVGSSHKGLLKKAVTSENTDSIETVRWLHNGELIFDRESESGGTRLWRADVARD
jgi:hypothetical protein